MAHNTSHSRPKRRRNTPWLLPLKNAVKKEDVPKQLPENFDMNCLAVDAACSGNPGPMEYRGVYLLTGQEVFHFGPVYGTNNIGEFLAIVHALALMFTRTAVMR